MSVNITTIGPDALTLEAMRLGVVPDAKLDPYTVGRDAEIEMVEKDLDRAIDRGGALRAFLGGYGTGKTHLLELIGQHALRKNFLVAHVVLNPEETAPSHPKRVYRELVRSLVYPDRSNGGGRSLVPLFEQALESEAATEMFGVNERSRARNSLDEGAHLYLTPALRYFKALTDSDVENRQNKKARELSAEEREYGLTLLFDWLEGHPTISNVEIDDTLRHMLGRQGRIYSMKDYRPWARIYGYLLSGISALARTVGYNGLVVLVDEAEFYSLLSSENRDYARYLFKALSFASMGGEADSLPFDRQELDELGGMGILQDLPPQYGIGREGEAPGLYTVFAMTPNEEGIDALGQAVPASAVAELSPFELADYRTLVERVFVHYQRARPEAEIDERIVGALGKVVSGLLGSGYVENPRQAMKFIVEFLDIAVFQPGEMKRVVQDLRSMYA
jgi:hypothetical protein